MDERDIEILKAMYELGDPSPKRIEAETGIPKSTVHYRLTKLQDAGVLENDLYELDAEKFGLGITVVTEVMAEYEEGYHEIVGSKLSEIEGVCDVFFTMGDTDFILVSRLADHRGVESLIEAFETIDEVERTSSRYVITTIKEEPNPLRTYSLDSLLELHARQDE
ncbi:Lrp/AsnC family transcriptional regulator [Halegenticoccus tardaugens]|uniref:Lrp/AsnC family transcriptional regulator n=1 Tax=Halegenticoccus tardaugens TaxID=2071624 RepID=UPI00100A7FF2|nr:Lrp/AsnC family transcriptional regulator [Halegenticoccus tardaugens]